MPIMKIKDENGVWHDVPALVGPTGPAGADGKDGKDGAPGADGHTPEKGVDYWTEADRQQMVSDVLAALPNASGVSF